MVIVFTKERAYALIGPFITIQDISVDVEKPGRGNQQFTVYEA